MSELDAIRAKRLAELAGASGSSGPVPQEGANAAQQQQQQAAKREEEEEAMRQMLGQILEPDARERLSRIALVRPERSRAISELLIRMARSGQLRGKVSEAQLLSVLDQVEANERAARGKGAPEAGKITFSRRKGASNSLDSDDDDDDLPARAPVSTSRRKVDDSDDDFDL